MTLIFSCFPWEILWYSWWKWFLQPWTSWTTPEARSGLLGGRLLRDICQETVLWFSPACHPHTEQTLHQESQEQLPLDDLHCTSIAGHLALFGPSGNPDPFPPHIDSKNQEGCWIGQLLSQISFHSCSSVNFRTGTDLSSPCRRAPSMSWEFWHLWGGGVSHRSRVRPG